MFGVYVCKTLQATTLVVACSINSYSAVANKTLSLKKQWQKVLKSNSQCSKTSLLSPVMLQRCYPVKQCAVGGPDAWWQANSEPNPQPFPFNADNDLTPGIADF